MCGNLYVPGSTRTISQNDDALGSLENGQRDFLTTESKYFFPSFLKLNVCVIYPWNTKQKNHLNLPKMPLINHFCQGLMYDLSHFVSAWKINHFEA